MSTISNWDIVAANNDAVAPDGFKEGQLPSSLNNCSREVMASVKKLYSDTNGTLTSTGTGAAYVLATNQAEAALAAGQEYSFKVHISNSSTTPTLTVDGNGLTITKNGVAALAVGDMVLNSLVTVKCDGTQFQLVSHVETAPITSLAASAIVNTPAGDIAATDVQTALDELDTEKEPSLTAASQAEMEAGTVTALRSMTPERVKQAIDALGTPYTAQSLIANGYISFAGGLIIQWGEKTGVSNLTTGTVTFPIAFPTAAFHSSFMQVTATSAAAAEKYSATLTTTQTTIANTSGVTATYRWIAIGH